MSTKIIIISKKILVLGTALLAMAGLFVISENFSRQKWKEEILTPGLKGKTVIVDPGHGGADPGAVVGKIHEKDLNMDIALALKEKLEQNGVRVKLTREGNDGIVPEKRMTYLQQWQILNERKNYAFEKRGHMLISIHTNSNKDSRASGGVVFYSDAISQELAGSIQKELNKIWAKKREIEKNNFTVISGNEMPSVLVETGFMTNPKDLGVLMSKKEIFAEAIYRGIEEYALNLKMLNDSKK